jgi:hypothetical protein
MPSSLSFPVSAAFWITESNYAIDWIRITGKFPTISGETNQSTPGGDSQWTQFQSASSRMDLATKPMNWSKADSIISSKMCNIMAHERYVGQNSSLRGSKIQNV